ncbi:cold shock and DUF1294 domain-containing protein [Methylomicrobium lacus]|uniref:cold shock and DUF1294 domain-containing protein n=1 Tax=Methylomicrobium lacus TaxID=136992 RepID=UPI00045EA99B|nr:cold shock and DUF1294 domain-containing protein [Methylomicrobium lacus]
MQTYQGIIKSWKPDRGFGFIETAAAEQDIFIHIRDIKHPGYQPQVGDLVRYRLMADKNGKIRAYDATIDGQPILRPSPQKIVPRSQSAGKQKQGLGPFFILIALTPFVFSGWLIIEQHNPLPFFVYLVMSLVTFLAYARDKTKAIKSEWRTQESTLHLLELLGGWPGALITQKTIRHKNKKISFQITFWLIAALHLACWVDWLFFSSRLLKILG